MGKNNYIEGHGTTVQKLSELVIKFRHFNTADKLFSRRFM
jgi:hypothetical protein